MAWLLALAVVLTFAAVGFAGVVSVVVTRDRRRRRQTRARRASAEVEIEPTPPQAEPSEAADCVQLWLDEQWHQRFGPGLTDSRDAIEG
jgi:hypothetical protein